MSGPSGLGRVLQRHLQDIQQLPTGLVESAHEEPRCFLERPAARRGHQHASRVPQGPLQRSVL